jgi:hypothetical protein
MTVLRDRVLLQRLKQLFAAGSRLGYIKPEFAAVGGDIEIEILGERKRATLLIDSPYDPENKDLRAWTSGCATHEQTIRPTPRNSARRST